MSDDVRFRGEPVEVLDLAETVVLVVRLGPVATAAGYDSRSEFARDLTNATGRPVVMLDDGVEIESLSAAALADVGLSRIEEP